ncbi:MAG: hypothetical protein Q4G65_18740, partial [bacterium]|nr:hypothetical protein [bacterium]
YGAPNTWHKQKHRGRKRCGMLFAMPSVRTKLGLKARPKYDPDVNAKRLVQADPYLASILYGSVDTMAAHYGRGRSQIGVAPTAAAAAPVASSKGTAPGKGAASSKNVASRVSAPKTAKPAKPVKPAPRSVAAPAKTVTPPPVKKPPLIIPKPPEEPKPEVAKTEEEATDWLRVVGLKGGYFRKKARLVVPAAPAPASPEPETETAGGQSPSDDTDLEGGQSPNADTLVLPLPKDLHIGKMGDDVKDLEALAKLPDYARGGPVTADLSPFRIAGGAWRSPSTYYYSPSGKIVTGDKVDERSIEVGTFIFYKK